MYEAKFVDCRRLALRTCATVQNLIPSFHWILPVLGGRRNPRKGNDQIWPSGNTDFKSIQLKLNIKSNLLNAILTMKSLHQSPNMHATCYL